MKLGKVEILNIIRVISQANTVVFLREIIQYFFQFTKF